MPSRRARTSANTVTDSTVNIDSVEANPDTWDGTKQLLGVWLSMLPSAVRSGDEDMDLLVKLGVSYNYSNNKLVCPTQQHALDYRDGLIGEASWEAPSRTRPDLATTPKPAAGGGNGTRNLARAIASSVASAISGFVGDRKRDKRGAVTTGAVTAAATARRRQGRR